jgi:hypothetical protein
MVDVQLQSLVPRMSYQIGRITWKLVDTDGGVGKRLLVDQTVKLGNDEVNIRLGRTAIIVRQ